MHERMRASVSILLLLILIVATGCLGPYSETSREDELTGDEISERDGLTGDGRNATSVFDGNETGENRTTGKSSNGDEEVSTDRTAVSHITPETLAPENYRAWISKTPLRFETVDGVRKARPLRPRTPSQIAEDMDQRERFQKRNAARSQVHHDISFTNVTGESGIRFEHDPLPISLRYTQAGGPYFHYPGVATADVDEDGDQDLYFVNQAGPNELWMNRGDGSFRNATAETETAVKGQVSSSAAFGDVDNDGYQDLYVTTLTGENHLFLNDGDGTYSDVSEISGTDYEGRSSSAVFFDHDGDGLLDLYVVNLANFTVPVEGPKGYPRTSTRFNGFPNEFAESSVLYTNQGDSTFQETDSVLSRSSGWDGEAALVPSTGSPPDVYVGQIAGPDGLYENTESGFEDVTEERIGETPMGSFGVVVLDADNDGAFDIYVTDKHSDVMVVGADTGWNLSQMRESIPTHEMADNMQYVEGMEPREDLLYGSAFYSKNETGYREISKSEGLETFLPWGASKGDFNADGTTDLFVTGGMEYQWYVPDALLLNEPDGGFLRSEFLTDIHPRESRYVTWNRMNCSGFRVGWCGVHEGEELEGYIEVENRRSSRGSVTVDVDGDGDMDIVTNEFNGPPRVLENDLAQRSNRRYLKIELEGSKSPRDGTGAVVVVETNKSSYYRFVDGKSYLAQSSQPEYFGLQPREEVDEIEVSWPSGEIIRYEISDPGRKVVLEERREDDPGR